MEVGRDRVDDVVLELGRVLERHELIDEPADAGVDPVHDPAAVDVAGERLAAAVDARERVAIGLDLASGLGELAQLAQGHPRVAA